MRIKNMIKKAIVAALTAVMIFAPIVNVKASSSDVIDTSKTGSITIHKYDMTAAYQTDQEKRSCLRRGRLQRRYLL